MKKEFNNGDCIYNEETGKLIGEFVGRNFNGECVIEQDLREYITLSSHCLTNVRPKTEEEIQKEKDMVEGVFHIKKFINTWVVVDGDICEALAKQLYIAGFRRN